MEGKIDSGSVAYSLVVEKGGIFWKEEVDSGSVTLFKTRYILGGRGNYGSVTYNCQKKGGIYSGICKLREGRI